MVKSNIKVMNNLIHFWIFAVGMDSICADVMEFVAGIIDSYLQYSDNISACVVWR